MAKNKVFVKILFGIILGILIVSFMNVGISLFLTAPEFSDFCDDPVPRPAAIEGNMPVSVDDGKECRDAYDEARSDHSKIVFYILAPLGLILLMVGVFLSNLTMQIALMGAGGINMIVAIMRNLEDKLFVFITIGILIVIAIYFVFKKLRD